MKNNHFLKNFFFPSLTIAFLTRICFVAAIAVIVFTYILIPFTINGRSMEPTYQNGHVNFCWRPAYLFSHPNRHDIVAVRFAGKHIMLLKRVVGLEGETVEFRNGELFINREKLSEPYVTYPCDWNLPPRMVKEGHMYVVGDNRNVPIQTHDFGQTPVKRIVGAPLW
jgi:signal peptidase I